MGKGKQHNTINVAKDRVLALVEEISSHLNTPVYYNAVYKILDADDRPTPDVQSEVPESEFDHMVQYTDLRGQMWLGMVEDARLAIHAAFDKLREQQNDNEQSDGTPYDPQRIHKTTMVLERMEGFVLSLQRSINQITRTHQETFYNKYHHRETEASFRQAIEESIKWLYDHNDV